MVRAAIMDNPAPDNDASVKSLGIFLLTTSNWEVNVNATNILQLYVTIIK